MDQIILGCVGTAVRKSSIRGKLASDPDFEVRDVDRILCNRSQTRDELIASGAHRFRDSSETPRMIDIVQRLPRTQVLRLWGEALQDATAGLHGSERRCRVLLTGAMYHSNRRSEFYSPLDLILIERALREQQLEVGRIVMFIDDIYDMWQRLSSNSEIYDRSDSMENEFLRLRDEEKRDPGTLSLDERILLATEVQVAQLVRLLHWRQLEATQAERAAASFRVPYLLWAMKQKVSALRPWLIGSQAAVVYVSHPISRPRRQYNENHVWPLFVAECNAVQEELAALQTTAVMPTAIDEYRLQKEPIGIETRAKRRPKLGARWPLIGQDLLYGSEVSGAPDHVELLKPIVFDVSDGSVTPVPDDWGNSVLLDGPLRSLEREIEGQVASRDHTLVVHTDHIVVFRPFFAEPHISGGVVAEIRHWSTLAQTDPGRRIAFLHRHSEAKAVLESRESLAGDVELAMQELVAEEMSIEVQNAAKVIRAVGTREWNMLDLGADTIEDRELAKIAVETAKDGARRRALWKILAQYTVYIERVAEERVGLWVIDDTQPWSEVWSEVIGFLCGNALSSSAYSEGLSLIP